MQIGSIVKHNEKVGVVTQTFMIEDSDGDSFLREVEVLFEGNKNIEKLEVDDLEDITPYQYINIYLIDRAYGGPEEGGWWYDTQDLEESRWFSTEQNAENALQDIENIYEQENKERNSNIYSVCSDGKYVVRLEQYLGESSPAYKPHYC